jgi:hypothetical protein
MPKGKKTSHDPPSAKPLGMPSARHAEGREDSAAASDERVHQSAYITDDGRHFRALYNPEVHDPRWFVRSFMVGPDGSPVDVRDYPERYFDEEAAWEGVRRAADAAPRER